MIPCPLETMLNEMMRAVDASMGLVALATAVAVPAICASLSMECGRSGGPDYKAWCGMNLRPKKGFDLITDEELYSLRNGLLHQGRSEMLTKKKDGSLVDDHPHNQVKFVETPAGWTIQDNSVNREYVHSIRDFCGNMANAAIAWRNAQSENLTVQKHLKSMLTYRPFESAGISIVTDPPLRAVF